MAKTIVGYANGDGGVLFVGVSNDGEAFGLTLDEVDKTKTWDDVLYTEEEIHQYVQMPESPAPFNPETIFSSNEPVKEQSGPVLTKKLALPKSR